MKAAVQQVLNKSSVVFKVKAAGFVLKAGIFPRREVWWLLFSVLMLK